MSTFDIDVAGATEALNGAGGVENLMAAERGEPVVQTTPSEVQTPDVATSQEAPVQTTEAPAEDAGWSLNIAELPAEVQPLAKSLLGDYTRKTQEIAEARKQFEGLGSIEELQQARELYETLQDPSSWPALHAEITRGLVQMGYSVADAQQVASDQITQAAEQPQAPVLPELATEDPELKPYADHIAAMRSEVQALQDELRQRTEVERQAQVRAAIEGELTRQENLIRGANPNYSDDDINAIYQRASYFNGNLIEAQKAFASDEARMLERYLGQKQAAGQVTIPAAGSGAVQTTQPTEIKTFDEAHAATMARLRQLGELDT